MTSSFEIMKTDLLCSIFAATVHLKLVLFSPTLFLCALLRVLHAVVYNASARHIGVYSLACELRVTDDLLCRLSVMDNVPP